MNLKQSLITLCITICIVSGNANAQAYSFTDTSNVWAGLENKANPSNTDTYGIPDLLGGSFNFTGHTLTSITLNYRNNQVDVAGYNQNLWNSVTTKDWYFDFDSATAAVDAFDFVLHKETNGAYTLYSKDEGWGYGTAAAYEFNSSTKKFSDYVESTSSVGSPRKDHPVAANAESLKYASIVGSSTIGQVSMTSWSTYANSILNPVNHLGQTLSVTWDLSGLSGGGWNLDQYSGDNFTYAFALSCANDVLYGTSSVPTPEPGTILLMAAGGIGVFLLNRRTRRTRL